MEVEWKWNGIIHLERKYIGIRMELEWNQISTVEIQLKDVTFTIHHSFLSVHLYDRLSQP